MSKEVLQNLIETIKNLTGLSQGEISVKAGYKKETLAQLKANPEKHDAAIRQLNIAFQDILTKSTGKDKEVNIQSIAKGKHDTYQDKYIAQLEKTNTFFEGRILDLEATIKRYQSSVDILKKNLDDLLKNQVTIHANVHGALQVILTKLSKSEKEKQALLDTVHNIAVETMLDNERKGSVLDIYT